MTLTIKQFIGKIEVAKNERTITAVISTSGVDRDHEILLAKGADLKAYKKNPVVLWAHDHWGTPIAKALWVRKTDDELIAKMQFPAEGKSPKSDEVYELFKGGFLNAFSVGFRPMSIRTVTPEDVKENPHWKDVQRVFEKWELLEFSAVPVPANPAALVTAVKSKAIKLSDEIIEEMECKINPDGVGEKSDETITNRPFVTVIKSLEVRKAIEVKKPESLSSEQVSEYIADQVKDSIDKMKGKVY